MTTLCYLPAHELHFILAYHKIALVNLIQIFIMASINWPKQYQNSQTKFIVYYAFKLVLDRSIQYLFHILITFLQIKTMILKLVYGKEIHVYDLKGGQTLLHVFQKIRQLFRKLPQQFVVCYKDSEGEQIPLENNQQFNILITAIDNDLKVFKLFIKGCNQPAQKKTQTKSEQKVQMPAEHQNHEMIQVPQQVSQNDQVSQISPNLTQMKQQQQKLEKHSEGSLKEQDKMQGTQEKELQAVEVPQEVSFGKILDQRDYDSRRQNNAMMDEHSDPCELREMQNGLNQQDKQNFSKSMPQNQEFQVEKENPHIWQLYEQLQQQKLQAKPLSQQIIQPNISYKTNAQKAQPKCEQNDRFKTHNAKCDICNVTPICGTRYMCVLCQNYDLCQKCEDRFSHQHPLLKVCYTYQTPMKMQVQIPQLTNKLQEQRKKPIAYETVDLGQLRIQQRKQRILSISSQISQLLEIEIKQCLQFIKLNEKYTKETLIQMLVDSKFCGVGGKIQESHKQEGEFGFGAMINNLKRKFIG